MAYSIMDMGTNTRQQAMTGLRSATEQEHQREMQNENIKQAEKQQTISSVGMGMTTGAMIAGPYGAAAGAVIGLIAGELF